jgi:very-short-patch-repair endonuclease
VTAMIVRELRQLVLSHGWHAGTALENRIARRLILGGFRATEVSFQHRIGRYRIDFAFTDVQVALEADGPWHLQPEMAVRDAERDRWLRGQGWVVLRVNDGDDDFLTDQVSRIAQIIRLLRLR